MPGQVGYAHPVLREITREDQRLLELEIVVLFVQAFVLVVLALQQGVQGGYLK